MKNIFCIAALLITMSIALVGQTQNVVSIKYAGYSLTVPVVLQGFNDAELAPFVAGKIDSLPKKAEQSRFGILFREDAKNLSGITLIEILDAVTGKVIRKITLDEYFNGKDNELKFIKEIALVDDEALPGGKKLEVSFSLQSPTAMKVKARFYGKVEGTLTQASNGFVVTNNESLTQLKPALLFQVVSGIPAQVEILKKGKQQSVVVTGNTITLEANQKTKVLTFDIIGSTISFSKYITEQIENVKSYYSGKKTAPSIAVVTVSEKPKTAPRDTMTYVIYYHNIGTAPATDVNVKGIIPVGTEYLAGSAVAEMKDIEISFERKEVEAPKVGEVLSIKWNDKSKIKSGEERWIRYKVVVR